MADVELGGLRYDHQHDEMVRFFETANTSGLIRVPFDSPDDYTYALSVDANEPLRVVGEDEIQGATLLGPNRETLIRYIQSDQTMSSLVDSLVSPSVVWRPDPSLKSSPDYKEIWIVKDDSLSFVKRALVSARLLGTRLRFL